MIDRDTAAWVLLVNSFDGRQMYAEYLLAHGLHVCAVATPEEALGALARVKPSVVVSDSVFLHSGYTGTTFIRALRSREDCRQTPVIMVSGYAREEDRDEAREAGANVFLLKPCLPEHLLSEIRRALVARDEGRRLGWNWPKRPATTADRPHGERRKRIT
jgi:two-component system, cell cycle response regulator DivK